MALKIGMVTIGQSPRVDIVPEIEELLSADIEIIEKGALDGLTLEEVQMFEPREDDEILVTRMQDGTEVTVGRNFILPQLQKRISELDQEGVALIALLCSGGFPPLRSEKPLIMPDKLLSGVLSAISIEGGLGVMVPSARQVNSVKESFEGLGFKTIGVGASPYGDGEAIAEAAERLKGKVDLVVMHCFGYNLEMKRRVGEITKRPVIAVRSLLTRALKELI